MSSTFLGLTITGSGLNAAQIGLSVTTNNMSNIDTDGYSRQVVNQVSIGPAAVYSSSLVGSGVDITSVARIRSFRLDQIYWQENSVSSSWEAQSNYLTQIERFFGNSDSSYITTALDTFNSDLESLANDPTSSSARKVVLEAANEFCSTLNDASSQLTQLRNDANSDVKTTVGQINAYAEQISSLNKQISVATASGASASELKDQRDLLVDQLSGLVGIKVNQSGDGDYNITIGKTSLVSGNKADQLECYTNSEGMYNIRWANSKEDLDIGDSGSLRGLLGIRDGSTSDSQGIPYYLSQLDDFARTFAKAFNEGVTSGTTTYSGHADGVGLDDTTGIRFFSYDNLSSADLMASGSDIDAVYQNITAANISVSSDIQEDTDKIATASSDGEEENNNNISDIINICEKAAISGNATVDDLYNSIIATAGTASSFAQTEYERTNTITDYIATNRSSISGVSSDEETVNLTTYQAAYEAAASLTSTWSKIYDTTINMVNTD